MRENVLFICVHNSARSQMAAALLNQICADLFQAQSAGLEAGTLNPLAVEALQEIGIDISRAKTQSVSDVFNSGQLFAYVITVCSESESKGCPVFAGVTQRLHWSFPDPSQFTGTHNEKMARTRELWSKFARGSKPSVKSFAPSRRDLSVSAIERRAFLQLGNYQSLLLRKKVTAH